MSDDDAHGPRPAPLSPEHKLIFAQGKRRLLENMFGMPGEVGRFELRRKLGEGGMGAVYLAWDPRLEREVALKLPSIEHPDLRRRFIREAKFMAKLDHPNTVAIYEAGELEGQAYIAMELIEGPTLEAWLAEGPRSSEAILERFLDAGRGLAEVHAQGLVHRDFKPGNVMIDPRGRARVMDFGLARSAEHDGSGDSPLTRTGMILGTLAYMSPEQVEGARVGPRSDQFSFCVALYEALYGARPYAHDGEGLPTFTELDAGALPGERPEGLSLGAERALVRGLQLDRAGRFEDMDALLVALTNAALRDEEPRADSLGRAETLDLVEASTLGLAGGREAAPARTSASAEVAAGRMIDKYVVTRLLGKGGMGVVHVAYEPALDRKVALKLLERSRRHSNADLLRFAREARGLARVRHPNVVEIYNFGPCDDGMFIAMEYVEGATLADWREQSGADWRAILEVMVGAGRGLAAAHEHGLVHRDFKPSNAIVGEDGRVRVLDFGLVRPIDGDEDELTAKHAVIGTYRYMALEQIEGQAVGPAADQFSFCVVAFELLYGESPFAGRNVAQRGLNMRAGAIAARPRDSPVPRRVHAALVRGLAAAPGRRWPSMEALLAELEACLEVQRRRRWLGLGLGGGVATLGLGLLAAWVIGLLWARLHEREAELAAANEALGQRNVELEQRNVELARSVDIELARTLAATARAPRQRVDALTGAVELYACYALGLSGCASTPGQGVPWQVEAAMFATTRGLRRAWERGGHEASITALAATPLGERLATGDAAGRTILWDGRTGEVIASLDEHIQAITSITFSPDGDRVLTTSADTSAMLWHASSGGRIDTFGDREFTAGAFSPAGGLLALGSAKGAIVLVRLGGDEDHGEAQDEGSLLFVGEGAGEGSIKVLSFSPDGRRLVAAAATGSAFMWELGDEVRRIAVLDASGATTETLAFSADGRRLASVGADGRPRLWDGHTGELVAVLDARFERVRALSFSPDGRRLLGAGEGGVPRLWDPEDGRVLASLGERGLETRVAIFSPDGRTLATSSLDSIVWLWDAEQARLLDTLEGQGGLLDHARFFDGGRRLAVASSEGRLRVWTLATPTSKQLVEARATPRSRVALSGDGARLATAAAGVVSVWDTGGGADDDALELDGELEVDALALDGEGRALATGDAHGRVQLWDARTGELLRTLADEGPAVTSLVLSPRADSLLAGDAGLGLRLWALPGGELLTEVRPDARADLFVSALAVSRDGAHFASADSFGGVQLWGSGLEPLARREHGAPVLALALSNDGRRLAAAGIGERLSIFDLEADEVLSLANGDTVVYGLAFSPDDRRVLVGGSLHLRAWDLDARAIVADFEHHGAPVHAVGFGEEGRWAWAVSAYGRLQHHAADPELRLQLACEALREVPEGLALADTCAQLRAVPGR